MIKIIKRTTDNKFLQSVETDTWVDNVKDAFEMTYRECNTAKTEILNTYTSEQIVEIVNFSKSKPITQEEKKELFNLLKNK
jgi:zona occludens toxin (predicted ATPase)